MRSRHYQLGVAIQHQRRRDTIPATGQGVIQGVQPNGDVTVCINGDPVAVPATNGVNGYQPNPGDLVRVEQSINGGWALIVGVVQGANGQPRPAAQ